METVGSSTLLQVALTCYRTANEMCVSNLFTIKSLCDHIHVSCVVHCVMVCHTLAIATSLIRSHSHRHSVAAMSHTVGLEGDTVL